MSDDARIRAAKAETALRAVLLPHKEAIIKRWVEIVHGTYPFETIGFLRTSKDRFANPVGYRTENAAATLADVLFTEWPDEAALLHAVDELIRVRAVQDFPPETAVGIIYAMKELARETVLASGQADICLPALLALESRIDAVVLMAFGVYARCREKLHQLKVDEFRRAHSQALRLAERKRNGEDSENNNR
jgi:hypothetical protein